MADSVTEALQQLIALQSQQLNAINTLVGNQRMGQGGMNQASYNGTYISQAPNYLSSGYNPFTEGAARMQSKLSSVQGQMSGGVIGSVFANQSQISAETHQLRSTEFGNRTYNAFLNGTSGLASAGGSALGSALAGGGLFAGMVGATAGGAIAGSLFAIGMDQTKQAQAYNKYLLENSSRFISAGESKNERGTAGFSTNERSKVSNFLRNFNHTAQISDTDTMQLLQGFTEGNLMRDVSNLETFQKKFSMLTKFAKQASLTLNASYKEVTEMMADFEKRGVSASNLPYLASKAKISGTYTGLSAVEQTSLSSNIAANLTSGTGISAAQAMSNSSDISAMVSSMFDKAKNDPGKQTFVSLVGNFGGIGGAASTVAGKAQSLLQDDRFKMAGILFNDYNEQTGQFEMDTNKFSDIMSGKYNASEISSMAANKLSALAQTNPQIAAQWQSFGGEYLSNMTTSQTDTFLVGMLNAFQKSTSFAGQNMSSGQQLNLLLGDNTDAGRLLGSVLDEFKNGGGDFLKGLEKATASQSVLDSINSQNSGFYGKTKNVWENFKDYVGEGFMPLNDVFTKASQSVGDWWSGKKYNSAEFVGKEMYSMTDLEKSFSGLSSTISKVSKALDDIPTASESVKKSFKEAADSIGSSSSSVMSSSYDNTVGRAAMSNLFASTMANGNRSIYNATALTYSNNGIGSTAQVTTAGNKLASLVSGDAYQLFGEALGVSYDKSTTSKTNVLNAVDAKYRELRSSMGDENWAKKSSLEKAQDYQMLAAINKNFGAKLGYNKDDLDISKFGFTASDIANMEANGIKISNGEVSADNVASYLGASYGNKAYMSVGGKSGDSLSKLLSKAKSQMEDADQARLNASENLIKLANSASTTEMQEAIRNHDVEAINKLMVGASAADKATLQGALNNITTIKADNGELSGAVRDLEKVSDSADFFSKAGATFASAAGHKNGLLDIDVKKDTPAEINEKMQKNKELMSSWMFEMKDNDRNSFIQSLGISPEKQQEIISSLNGAKSSGGSIDTAEMKSVVEQIMNAMASDATGGSVSSSSDTSGIKASDVENSAQKTRDAWQTLFDEYNKDYDMVQQQITDINNRITR